MEGLVYGLTQLPSSGHLPVYKRPIFWATVIAGVFVILQILFW
jgi:SSS family solute:Na+ symporter